MNNTHIPACSSAWPELNYTSWADTLKTLHMWTQIVGKVRLVGMPWQNHSWHTTLYISARGLTTGGIPYQNGIFEIEFDFANHQLRITTSFGPEAIIELKSMSVADFYKQLFVEMGKMGIDIDIHASPNEVEESIPFIENELNSSYDRQKVSDFWQIAVSTHNVFSRFRSDFVGKCSPVHFFWGAFDIAVTRFSGRKAPLHQGNIPNMPKEVMQEAYSQEVSSAGFWPGSEQSPQPVYYSYCYPTPDSYGQRKVLPVEAFYSEEMEEFFLPYDVVRQAKNPEEMLMDFLQTTYVAAAETANWDRKNLER